MGSCQGPKDIPDSVAQAGAAASRILATIAQGEVEVEVTTAVVNEDLCCGCQTCIKVCPYSAVSFDEEKKVSTVNEVLCKGCGTCGSTCPTGAIVFGGWDAVVGEPCPGDDRAGQRALRRGSIRWSHPG